MILRTGLVLTSLLFLAHAVFAQSITVSERHSTMGYPLKERYEWQLSQPPLTITFLYNNGKTTIDHSTVNFFLKNESIPNSEKERITVSIGQRRNWVATKHSIQDPGDYTVTISLPGRENEILATRKFSVSGSKPAPVQPKKPEPKPEPIKPIVEKKEPPKPKPEATKPPVEAKPNDNVSIADLMEMNSKIITDLPGIKLDLPEIELVEDEEVAKEFEHMFIQFGRKIESGMLMGQNEKFKWLEGGTPIISSFSHTKAFDTKMIGVSVWLKPKGSREFSVHYDEIKIPVLPTDKSAKFDINFLHKGYYRFELYNEDLIKIREVQVFIY